MAGLPEELQTESSTKENFYRQTNDGKFLCIKCAKTLSSKQRVLEHLHKVHNLTPVKRAKKRYVDDESVPVPRRTLHRWKKKGNSCEPHVKKSLDFYLCRSEGAPPAAHSQVQLLQSNNPCDFSGLESDDVQFPIPTVSSGSSENPVSPPAISSKSSDDTESPLLLQSLSDSDLENDVCPKQTDTTDNNYLEQSEDDMEIQDEMSDTDSSSDDISCDMYTDSDVESLSSYNTSLDLSSENDFEETALDTNSEKESNVPEKNYKYLSLLSCFLRNRFSASTCKDVVETLKATFTESTDISSLDLGEMLACVDTTPVHDIHYCIACNKVFPTDKDKFRCQTRNCDGLRYKGTLDAQTKKTRQPRQSFMFADIKKQLTDLLQAPGIWQDIEETKREAFKRWESDTNILTDISDGSSYRKLMVDGGFLDKTTNNLTAIFNTDGVNLYSSSKVELWPIFLAINELSPPKRFSRENILLAGIWQGKGKPPFEEYFRMFSEFMNPLYDEGVNVQIDEDTFCVKISVVCGIADLPAKAELLNMTYFNGSNACIACEEPGISVKQGKGNARCFPYNLPGTRSQSRDHKSVLQHMKSGMPKKRSMGFKGVSGLTSLQNFDLVSGMVPDYMHGVLLGVTKTLLNKWFGSSQSKKDYFIGNHLRDISMLMKNIKPPESIERLPRDLEKHYQHFKATELQSWLLYYAFPCVSPFLKEEYLENLTCLSEGIHILLGDCITRQQLTKADELLDQFYGSFQSLYGDGSCGLNVHNTGIHLYEYVKCWGPLWVFSCFPFEDANSVLLQAVHGTGVVLKQVMKYRQAQAYIRRNGLELKRKTGWKITKTALNCDIAGAAKPLTADKVPNEVKIQLGENLQDMKTVDRILVNGKRFYSEQYSRMQKRVCSVVRYGNGSIGTIKYFIICNDIVYSVIEKLHKIPYSEMQRIRVASHYIPVRHTGILEVRDAVDMEDVLVYLNTRSDHTIYVVQMPNSYGHAVFK